MRARWAWIAVALVVSGCAGGTRDARLVELFQVSSDGRTLSVAVDSCNAEPIVEIVEQGADRVVLTAVAEPNAGGDCADVVSVVLDEPWGNRRLVDGPSGDDVITDRALVTDDPVV